MSETFNGKIIVQFLIKSYQNGLFYTQNIVCDLERNAILLVFSLHLSEFDLFGVKLEPIVRINPGMGVIHKISSLFEISI